MTLLVEDRALCDAFRRGDKTALTRVYREYAGDVLAFLKRGFVFESSSKRLHFQGFSESWHVEGMAQEIFIRAFSESARHGYDGLRPYKNYLFTIAKNLVIDQLRRKNRELLGFEEVGECAEADVLGAPNATPEAGASEQELQQHVVAFVEELAEGERLFFQERFERGRSVEGVSRALGMTEYKVKRTEKAIKKRFFLYMRGHGYFAHVEFDQLGVERAVGLILLLGGPWSSL